METFDNEVNWLNKIISPNRRLSNENVSSVYDDRLDKVDPEGTLQPRQRRWAVVTRSLQCVTLSQYHPMVLVEWHPICIQTRSSTHL